MRKRFHECVRSIEVMADMMNESHLHSPFTLSLTGCLVAACSAGAPQDSEGGAEQSSDSHAGKGTTGPSGGADDIQFEPAGDAGGATAEGEFDEENPENCQVAAENRTYVGCEFWPTITYNPIFEGFDFAVVLANGGTSEAQVEVTGGALAVAVTETVPPGELRVIALPWVSELKGSEWANPNTSGGREYFSGRAVGGAYRVTSTMPLSAWQFNPLQYRKPMGEVAGCTTSFMQPDCFSVSNDASLLIPTTALTGNYRIFGWEGDENGDWGSAAGAFAVTATAKGTLVDIQYGPGCDASTPGVEGGGCTAGGEFAEQPPGGIETLELNAGDVVQIVGDYAKWTSHADLSGTVVQANHPVQVIAFNPLTNVPDPTQGNSDHIEETVLPAEALGTEYIVVPPTTPSGGVVGGHLVRVYGNVDGTTLSWSGEPPSGAPTALDAGDVWESRAHTGSFRVKGSEPFAVVSFMLGGGAQGGSECRSINDFSCSGDPAMSMMVTPEQFRSSYTFLAPTDYETNYADVLMPTGARVTLAGTPVAPSEEAVDGWSVARVPLTGTDGIYRLESDVPVGLQVMGFGHATSYYYPGGLNLKLISEPPPPIPVVR